MSGTSDERRTTTPVPTSSDRAVLGFVGDVGDLADCLWCVLTLADEYGVDLELSFTDTMSALTRDLIESTAGD